MIDHPLRQTLNDELHSRPGMAVASPARITHLAFTLSDGDGDPLAQVRQLCDTLGVRPPEHDAQHHGVAVGSGLFKYERHSEFYRISVTASGEGLTEEAMARLPLGWVDQLPGERIVAIHTHILAKKSKLPTLAHIIRHFGHDEVACSRIHQGRSTVWSDFRIGKDGFTRMLVHDGGVSPDRLGRLTRRLHEIETYRMMALLAYPMARNLQGPLRALELSLSEAIDAMLSAKEAEDDAALLQRLSMIARDVERISNQTSYRFSAAKAYAALVDKRLSELGEERVMNFQRLGIFLDRRFAPAMATCHAVAARILSLAERCERASNLLRTRVDIALEGQNQKLLHSMNERARQQLMLQQTVEGLSVAAISYYVIGIIDRFLEGLGHSLPWLTTWPTELVVIPVVIGLVWSGARMIRRRITRTPDHAIKN